jgi:hypothetical protein
VTVLEALRLKPPFVSMASAQTAEAESDEPREVLERHTPLCRDSLKEREIVESLWQEAGRLSTVSQTSYGCAQVYRAFDHSPAHEFEIRTALDYHGVSETESTSQGFENEIARHNG